MPKTRPFRTDTTGIDPHLRQPLIRIVRPQAQQYSARDVNMRYGSGGPFVIRSSISTPI